MIEWKEYDPNKPPKDGQYLILTDWCGDPFIRQGHWKDKFGFWAVRGAGTHFNVTHYAEINLPKPKPVITDDPNQVRLELDGKIRGGK